MQFINYLPSLDAAFWKVFIPVLVLGTLVFIHELGHFLAAKYCGVGVVKFSIGFGPSIFRAKVGETIYQLSIIPLGGFVRMVGDMPDPITGPQESDAAVREGDESILHDRSKWFIEKKLWERSLIVFAGPAFNFISAFIFVALAGLLYGKNLPVEASVIGGVSKGSPAAEAGLQAGDLVLQIAETPVSTWKELAARMQLGPDSPLPVRINRNGEELTISVTPRKGSVQTVSGTPRQGFLIGVKPSTETIPVSTVEALTHGGRWTWAATVRTVEGMVGMLMGQVSKDELAGPIFIFDAASEQAKKGFEETLYFMALLSVSLAVLNLLPIPVLDGGHLFFFLLEALFGPLSIKKKEIAQQIGFAFLILLMGFALTNDLRREKIQMPGEVEWERKNGSETQTNGSGIGNTERSVAPTVSDSESAPK